MKKLLAIILAFVALAVACVGATAGRVILIPLEPVDQKVSKQMRQQIAALNTESGLSALSSWVAIAELPAWVFDEKKREIAYIFGRPGVSDDYRYAVILGRSELIVVRAGGIAGSYDIFVKPRTPDTSPKPTAPSRRG